MLSILSEKVLHSHIGTYIYADIEVKNAIPRIVSDELFLKVQQMMEKNKKAPARSKANADYILTTKLFCGMCKSMMTGHSGTGKSGKTYYYYACVQAKKGQCTKKTVNKQWIEDLVVHETRKLLTTERINLIAKEVVALAKSESNTSELNRLKRLLSENEKATRNLIKALEQGQVVDVISNQIKFRQQEKQNLENAIAEESSKYPVLTVQEVRFFLHRLQKGDINDMKYRKTLVDVLVNRIYLYDDKMTILYNTQDGQKSFPLEQTCLPKGHLVEHGGFEPPTSTLRTLRATNCANAPSRLIMIQQALSKCKGFSLKSSARFLPSIP